MAKSHDDAYDAFVAALLDPEQKDLAMANKSLRPILAKLSDQDMMVLSDIMTKQNRTVCPG